ncbi:hypothetical protein G7046_g10075 [Stylonectria norvegica]|nr:hypothetical protein G7046_g10075 [Stylonectria norvegica]
MPFRQRMARHFGDSLGPEKPYLSYYDVLLTGEDMKALKNDWLTDNNIAFWEEYLERETLPRYPQARIILLRPSMTFLMMKEPDMRQVGAALPDFSKVTHIFLPINDARNVSVAEGGSHWSLLLVSALDGVAFHYDSLGGVNYSEANLASRKLSQILGRPLKFINLEDTPQQENGSDCGVFVCLLMRHLLVKRLLCANAREKVSMSMGGKMVDSNGGRKEMMRIIESLRKEGERRRSAACFGSYERFGKLLQENSQGRNEHLHLEVSGKRGLRARAPHAAIEWDSLNAASLGRRVSTNVERTDVESANEDGLSSAIKREKVDALTQPPSSVSVFDVKPRMPSGILKKRNRPLQYTPIKIRGKRRSQAKNVTVGCLAAPTS